VHALEAAENRSNAAHHPRPRHNTGKRDPTARPPFAEPAVPAPRNTLRAVKKKRRPAAYAAGRRRRKNPSRADQYVNRYPASEDGDCTVQMRVVVSQR
jgi:hypothetical protein